MVTISRVVDGLTELRLIGADTPKTFSARVREATDVDALGA